MLFNSSSIQAPTSDSRWPLRLPEHASWQLVLPYFCLQEINSWTGAIFFNLLKCLLLSWKKSCLADKERRRRQLRWIFPCHVFHICNINIWLRWRFPCYVFFSLHICNIDIWLRWRWPEIQLWQKASAKSQLHPKGTRPTCYYSKHYKSAKAGLNVI